MSGTTTGIWVIIVVAVVALAVFLLLVRYAARHQAHKTRRPERMRGVVQGGQHVGGGRSVAPHRDAPVAEGGGTTPNPDAPDVEDADVKDAETGQAGRRSGNPMDL
ncbi:MAG: hypothetical protein JO037_23620 [Actinobacteria bacterium]|nr:hypothetical protein [Actinomycetota bacterium]